VPSKKPLDDAKNVPYVVPAQKPFPPFRAMGGGTFIVKSAKKPKCKTPNKVTIKRLIMKRKFL